MGAPPYETGAVAHGSHMGAGAGQHTGAGGGQGGGQAGRRSQLQQQQPALPTVKARSAAVSDNLFIARVSLRGRESFGSFTASANPGFGAGTKLERRKKWATQPYPSANDVQTQRVKKGNIRSRASGVVASLRIAAMRRACLRANCGRRLRRRSRAASSMLCGPRQSIGVGDPFHKA